jgi:hypothetical protein
MAHDITYFFSYAREDSETVRKLAKELRSVGATLWIDQPDRGQSLDIGRG